MHNMSSRELQMSSTLQSPLLSDTTNNAHAYQTNTRSRANSVGDPLYYQSDDVLPHMTINTEDMEKLESSYPDKRHHEMESLTYVTVEHDAYFERQKHRKQRDEKIDMIRKWLTCLLIAICTGVIAFSIHWTIGKIVDLKYTWMEIFLHYEAQEQVHLAFLIFLACNLGLVTFSLIIINIWKPAGGSGLPEVKGYLNGTRIPKALNIVTLVTKVLSMITSVSAQLPAGPEGPFIHLGAMIGGGLGEWKSRTLRCQLPFMQNFRNSRDKRDFISCGAAAGVSAAFGSPIGGVLFSLEEVSSYWSQSLTWRTFFTCLMATFTVNFISKGFSGVYDLHSISIFNVGISKGYHIYEVPIFALVGVFGGILGGIFCRLNVALTKWRRDWLHKSRIRMAIELWLLVLFVSTVFFYFPMMATCRPKKGDDDKDAQLRYYLCPSSTTYNEMSTLFLSRMEDIIRNLFARNVPDRFSLETLGLFFITYYITACYTAGSAITAGLLIPMMIFGAAFGRFVGLILKMILPVLAIDPGTYAVVGAGAATGGITRMTISLTVIMLEITNDLNYLFPLMLAIICAKWVGDLLSHPLYDSLLELKGVNYLEPDPTLQMKALRCRDAMSTDPVCLSQTVAVVDIIKVLQETEHNAFPVIKSSTDRTFVGLIMRAYLLLMLKFTVLEGRTMFTSVEIDNILNDRRIELNELETRMTEQDYEKVLNLAPFVHRSSAVVYHDCSLSTAYTMFRSLGLRQLVVINHHNEPVGMITRVDLTHNHIEKVYEDTRYGSLPQLHED
jgi:chloride channel 7